MHLTRPHAVCLQSAPAPGDTPHPAPPPTVVFVLGGPGAGKGTQCSKLVRAARAARHSLSRPPSQVRDYGFTHLSAGDLLRAHMQTDSADGRLVAELIANGQIVPSSVTVNLLTSAMASSGCSRFLIDGFPRNSENRDAWERVAGYDCTFVLFYDVSEEVMTQRLLGRNQGRTDDNAATIAKRFRVFEDSTRPVLAHYEAKGKLVRVDGGRGVEEVYEATRPAFQQFAEKE